MLNVSIVSVASVSVIRDGEVLMVQENKLAVRGKWNFPSGRIEPGEEIVAAARREVKEETGYEVELTATTGIYSFISERNAHVMNFHFVGKIVGGTPQFDVDEVMDCKWVALPDILRMHPDELRGAEVIRQIAHNVISGCFYPLSIYHDHFSKGAR